MTRYVYYCKGYFEGGLFNLAMFDNCDAAQDFLVNQEGGTYNDIHYERIPVFGSLQEFHEG